MTQGKDKAAVVLLSGGLDSMVCAGLAREAGYRLLPATAHAGQRHVRLEGAALRRQTGCAGGALVGAVQGV